MKQKKCPQCKNLMQVTMPTCLYCGRPNKFVTSNYVKRKWEKEYKKDKFINLKMHLSTKLLFVFIVILIILVLILFK